MRVYPSEYLSECMSVCVCVLVFTCNPRTQKHLNNSAGAVDADADIGVFFK